MSTTSKLDPHNSKEAKQRRAEVCRMFRIAALNEKNPLKREAYIGLAHRLEKIRLNPRRSGAWKEAAFKRELQAMVKL